MSAILIAMSEEIHKISKKINTWEKILSLAQANQGLNEMLDKYMDNPYKIESLSKAIDISINLSPEVTLPTYISNAIFRTEITITGIKIYKDVIELKYRSIYDSNTANSYTYIIHSSSDEIMVKDLFLILYVFANMSEDNINEFDHLINMYLSRIDTEKKAIRNLLDIKGIKIEK